MQGALGWIGELVAWLVAWLPHVVLVSKTERAVKFIRGKTCEIGPGLHMYWPITTEVEVHAVVRQVLGLGPQTLTTEDDVSIVVDGILVFSIADLHVFKTENFEAEDSLTDLAQAAIRKAIVSETFAKVQKARADVDNRLTREAQKLLRPFGVEVEYMRIVSFAKAFVLNVIGDSRNGD